MQEDITEMLLRSAPKDRRLDLAMATLLYQVTQDAIFVVEQGKRVMVPIWYFSRNDQRSYAYTPTTAQHIPAPSGLIRPVPGYAQEEVWHEEVVHWLTYGRQGRLQVRCDYQGAQKVITVTLLSLEGASPRERRGDTFVSDWRKEVYRLTCLVVLDVFAPQLLPLLETDEVLTGWKPASFLEYPRNAFSEQLVLLPLLLPGGTSAFSECMHQEYCAATETWKRCVPPEDEEAEYPDSCPGCGGYYCRQHFSDVSYWFDCTVQERHGQQPSMRHRLGVCLSCARLPEIDVQRLRAARLAFATT